MAKTWLTIRVDLLHGSHTGDLWPTPGRVLVVSPRHTFYDLATAIDDAFARWDRSHLCEFTLADGSRIGVPDEDDEEPVSDYRRLPVARTVRLDTEFRYVFDFGDNWVHRCTVGPRKVDPVETLGITPDRPLPCFGWGAIPDQYGRNWDGDDGDSPVPRAPMDPDPMVSSSWPLHAESGRPRLRGSDLLELRGATYGGDREVIHALLKGRDPRALLQHAGDALLAVGTIGLEEVARDVERQLRERADDGDAELAAALAGRLGAATPMLRPVRVDVDQIAFMTTSDSGAWLDLQTGEVWPSDLLGNDEDTPDRDDDPDRWLWIEAAGSREGWQDRHDFAISLRSGSRRDRLLDALEGKGAFGRFSRALDSEPELLTDWRAFSAERERGRARSMLAANGRTPVPLAPR